MSDEQGPEVPAERAPRPTDPGVRSGHVHLRTADIDRVESFHVALDTEFDLEALLAE
jgi:catechol 2,3-dioxygenase